MNAEDIRSALAKHGRARTRARAKVKAESEAIATLIPEALDAGISKSEVARLAGITRPALDTMLNRL